jgi:hypothetical protein
MQRRIDAVRARVAGRPRPRVAFIEWVEPLMAGGNWMPELIEAAGGDNLFGAAGKHSDWMQWEELVAADPQVIIVGPCGYDLQRSLEELPILQAARLGGHRRRALRRVYFVDGNAYCNRPGRALPRPPRSWPRCCIRRVWPAAHRGLPGLQLSPVLSSSKHGCAARPPFDSSGLGIGARPRLAVVQHDDVWASAKNSQRSTTRPSAIDRGEQPPRRRSGRSADQGQQRAAIGTGTPPQHDRAQLLGVLARHR